MSNPHSSIRRGPTVLPVLLVALVAAGCHRPESLQRRYEQAASALRRGDLREARRLAVPPAESAWRAKFRLLQAEIMLSEGRAEQALSLLSSAVPDDRLDARRLMLQGDGLLKLDRYDAAQRALDEAANRAAALQLPDLAVEVDLQRGLLLTIQNAVPEAARILEAARVRAGQFHDPYLQSIALNNLAINRIRAYRFDEALAFASQALRFAGQAGAERMRAAALGNLGICQSHLGDFDKAQAYSEQAVALRETVGDLRGLQSALGILGNIYMTEGDARRAIPCYQRALAGAQQLNAESYASVWEANLAEALAEARDWDAAERFSREAQQHRFQDEQTRVSARLTQADIAAGRRQFAEAERLLTGIIDSAPQNPAQLWQAHASLANVCRETGRQREAGEHFESAIRLMEKTRSGLFQAEHRATFLSRWIRFYQDYVDLLMDQGRPERAFQVAESSRARILAERIGWREAHAGSAALSAYQDAARRMQAHLLSYWIAPRRSFLWLVSPRETRAFLLPGEKEIADLVDAHQNSVRNLRDPLAGDLSAGARLYAVLLGEAARILPAGSRVILAPDGPLHNLNFETLPVPGQPRHYWVEDAILSVAPALSLVLARPEPRPRAPASLLIIGAPEPASEDYPKLPHASEEIAAIERSFPKIAKTVYTGARANPAAYGESGPEKFSMIHFAAHGLANRASPLESAVVLSPKSGAFLLYARDIAEQPLRAKLVTIASCRSAGAKSYPGEGLLGLAWAFLRAGAEDVIAGLWDVSDESTAEVMAALYAGLAAGKRPAEALRAAKLGMLRRTDVFRKPYYWGPFQNYTSAPRAAER